MSETLKIKGHQAEAMPRETFMRSAAPELDIAEASLLAVVIRTGTRAPARSTSRTGLTIMS